MPGQFIGLLIQDTLFLTVCCAIVLIAVVFALSYRRDALRAQLQLAQQQTLLDELTGRLRLSCAHRYNAERAYERLLEYVEPLKGKQAERACAEAKMQLCEYVGEGQ